MLNTKQIGNITEIECMLSFIKLGYNVLIPYGDCERYDFVVDINNRMYRIQVKTANDKNIEDGYITFLCSNKTTKNGKFIHHSYTENEIDYFATFYNNKCYLIPISETSKRQKTLRFDVPHNGQSKGITFAGEYEIERMVNKIINN